MTPDRIRALREQVARRLYAKWGQYVLVDGEDLFGSSRGSKGMRAKWLRVADECIRLMEWARKEGVQCMARASRAKTLQEAADIASEPLTLPPAEWRP